MAVLIRKYIYFFKASFSSFGLEFLSFYLCNYIRRFWFCFVTFFFPVGNFFFGLVIMKHEMKFTITTL